MNNEEKKEEVKKELKEEVKEEKKEGIKEKKKKSIKEENKEEDKKEEKVKKIKKQKLTMEEKGYYSDNSDECDSYNIEDENRKLVDNILKVAGIDLNKHNDEIIMEGDILESFKKQYNVYSGKNNMPKDSKGPFERIKNIQKELEEDSKEINDYIAYYSGNILLKKTENFDEIIKDLDIYKEKINKLMNEEIFNKSNKLEKKRDNIKKELEKNIKNYSEITNNLIKKITQEKQNFTVKNLGEKNISYELLVDRSEEKKGDELKEIEEKLRNLEQSIGNWDNLNNNESITLEITRMYLFCEEKLDKNVEERNKIVNEINEAVDKFIKLKEDKEGNNVYFTKIRDLYRILELYESFENVFEYLTKRIKAIKYIHTDTKEFNKNIKLLEKKIKNNENKSEKLFQNFNETITEFNKMEGILKELSAIESKLSKFLIS